MELDRSDHPTLTRQHIRQTVHADHFLTRDLSALKDRSPSLDLVRPTGTETSTCEK